MAQWFETEMPTKRLRLLAILYAALGVIEVAGFVFQLISLADLRPDGGQVFSFVLACVIVLATCLLFVGTLREYRKRLRRDRDDKAEAAKIH